MNLNVHETCSLNVHSKVASRLGYIRRMMTLIYKKALREDQHLGLGSVSSIIRWIQIKRVNFFFQSSAVKMEMSYVAKVRGEVEIK